MDVPDHRRKISIGEASFARERACARCARSAEDRAGARRGAAASSRPGIGARAESATAGTRAPRRDVGRPTSRKPYGRERPSRT